jgi:predicted RNA-binding Zn-ribbon protein involved in translation (DUF1610 family)
MNCPECNVQMERTEKFRCPGCGAEFDRSDDWISVKVRLPKENGFYYACPTMENKAYPVRYIGGGNWVTLFGETLWKQPTHWADTPEPPKE